MPTQQTLTNKGRTLRSIAIVVVLFCKSAALAANAVPRAEIQFAIESVLHDRIEASIPAIHEALKQSDILMKIYAAQSFAPLWISEAQAEQLLALIAEARDDGLVVEDYHLSLLRTMSANAASSPLRAAEFDILLTDAFARLAYHLRFGKANPYELDSNWNFSRALVTTDPGKWLRDAIVENKIAAALSWLRPKIPAYQTLRAALRDYDERSKSGDWRTIAAGPTLKPGMNTPRVAQLRARLQPAASPAGRAQDANYFDADLALGVAEFQKHNGLLEDGFVGTKTLSALNQSPATIAAKLRVNLERIRWLFRDIEDEFIVVNIAAFEAAYLTRGEVAWRGRAVVGRPYRQTPSFKSTLKYLVFNPTWTVPPTILREDLLPAMRKDPSTLQRKHIGVFTSSNKEVDSSSIDWQRIGAKSFPYVLRQSPGPHNALGQVKFIFPNAHAVYMHDTPSRELFARTERTFSSGCIRIEGSLELAQILLDKYSDGERADVQDLLGTQSPLRVDLKPSVPVMLIYLTAFAAADGALQLRPDVYERDPAVLEALNGPFRFSAPSGY